MSPAARAARDFAGQSLAALDAVIAGQENILDLVRAGLRETTAARATVLAEVTADAGDAAGERRAIVAYLKSQAVTHIAPGTGGRLDDVGVAITQLAYAIERRAHLPPAVEVDVVADPRRHPEYETLTGYERTGRGENRG